MNSANNEDLVARIVALRLELDAVATDLGKAQDALTPVVHRDAEDVAPVTLARRIAASDQAMAPFFDTALFVDPARNIVLRLFIDQHDGRQTTSGICCAAAGVPRTTALRWINLLSARGLIEMYQMPSDRRATLLRLTPGGIENVGGWLLAMKTIFYSGGSEID